MWFWDLINNFLALVVIVGGIAFVLGGMYWGLERKR
jgi:hypothetical protein